MAAVSGQVRFQRSAERAQQRHQRTELAEARRAERLALLKRFVEVGAEAERVAFARPPEWDDTTPRKLTAQDVMNRLWVVERLVRVQFPLPVHGAARLPRRGPCGHTAGRVVLIRP